MTDWIDTYRARQIAEAEDRNAIDRIMMRSVWPGRPMRRRWAKWFEVLGDALGLASLIVAALAVYNAPEIVNALGWLAQ